MAYLVRVHIPDCPGSLGQLAEALGLIDANIESVDVVQQFNDGTVIDDMVIELSPDARPDTIITAAHALHGVEVKSVRPFSGVVDRRGQIEMLATVAQYRDTMCSAMEELVAVIPRTMTSDWGIVLSISPVHRVASSSAAPEDDGTTPSIPVSEARCLDPATEPWIPEAWSLLDSSLAATPLGNTGLVLIIGRPGGPAFLDSEVEHLSDLGEIIGSILT